MFHAVHPSNLFQRPLVKKRKFCVLSKYVAFSVSPVLKIIIQSHMLPQNTF